MSDQSNEENLRQKNDLANKQQLTTPSKLLQIFLWIIAIDVILLPKLLESDEKYTVMKISLKKLFKTTYNKLIFIR